MSRYPNAEWLPWKYNSDSGPTYYKGTNKPEAVVLHVMQGYLRTARSWASSGHYGASWHFSVGRDGTVLQHLDFEDGGYHAGIPASAKTPTWPLWKGHGVNVNNYTIGIEHEGFSGDGFSSAQAASSRDLCRWLAGEMGIEFERDWFPAHADIDLVNRPNDFAPPAQREEFYKFLFEEEDMGMSDNDVLAVFGSTEATREERLVNAKFRYQQAIETGHSPFDTAAQAIAQSNEHILNHAAGASGPVPAHTHKPGGVA